MTIWQRKLGTVDVVLNTWQDVQKKWQALESIFVGSADIRVQLPEDSKRFDAVNADYLVGPCSHPWACCAQQANANVLCARQGMRALCFGCTG